MDTNKLIYTCSIHPDVKSAKPGDCCKFGMTLSKKEKINDKINNIYSCSMLPEVKRDKHGKCPKCGITLAKKKMDKEKEEDLKMRDNKKHNR